MGQIASGLVLFVATLCAGCMATTQHVRVDELAAWRAGHTEALLAVLDAVADEQTAAVRRHIRNSLTIEKEELAQQLYGAAMEQMTGCVTTAEQVVDRSKVTRTRRKIDGAEADKLSRIGDAPRVYRLIHDLDRDQTEYWSRVAKKRTDCTKGVQHRLTHALSELDRTLGSVIGEVTEHVSTWRETWLGCQYEVRTELDAVGRSMDQLKRCNSSADGCGDGRDLSKSPLTGCVAILAKSPSVSEEAIEEGKSRLAWYFSYVASDLKGCLEYGSEESRRGGCVADEGTSPEPGSTAEKGAEKGSGQMILTVGGH